MKKFDQKFGKEFISTIPCDPGVYRVYGSAGELIYIGKAKNLRRRLAQYRNAKRCKKHHKMRIIVVQAKRIEFDICPTELEALLLEARLIQEHRPRWNVAGAFSFLYPLIGVQIKEGNAYFCYTTSPHKHPGFGFHGAFRSRHLTSNAFFSLMKLLDYVGHRIPRKSIVKSGIYFESKEPIYIFGFRQLNVTWVRDLEKFFKGESLSALEELVVGLLEHATALKNREEVQDQLNDLKRFWKHEASFLARMRKRTEYLEYPVPQNERDFIFLRHQMAAKEKKRIHSRRSESLEGS